MSNNSPSYIYYGGSGITAYPTGQPIPLFEKSLNSIRYGEKWGESSTVTLHGQLTGCNYDSIIYSKTLLERIYAKDFQPLTIIESGNVLYHSDYNIIRNINFGESSYVGILPYTVQIDCYPEFLWSGTYGVLDPVNEWSFDLQNNQIIIATHKISARGFNTSNNTNNAFNNAKNYVLSLTGSNSFINPYFVNYCTGISLCVDTFKENIDRFNNIYSIEEIYILDKYNGGAGYIRYSIEYECNLNTSISTVNINGEVKSCRNSDLTTLRAKYNSFNQFNAALTAYSDASNRTDLNPNYLALSVNEDPYSKKISFSRVFDNNFTPRTYCESVVDIKLDENDITYVTVKATIKSRGDLKTRYLLVEDYFSTLNLFNIANTAYREFYDNSPSYPLNPIEQSYSVTKNQFLGEIEVSKTYNNETILPSNLRSLDYTINFSPAINQIKSLPLVKGASTACNKYYYHVFLGFASRGRLSIQGDAAGICNGNTSTTINSIKNLVNNAVTTYLSNNKIYLEQNQLTNSNVGIGLGYSFNYAWSAESPAINPSPYNYVNTLALK